MENKNTHIMYGFITGIALVIVGLIIYLAGWSFKPGMSYVAYIPFLIGVILNGMAFSKANDGFVTFGNVFGSCFKASMIVAIVVVVWTIVSIFIFPEMKDKAMDAAREAASKRPGVTDEQIEMSVNIIKKGWNVILISYAIFGTLFFGAIFSLIGGAVAEKKGLKPFQPID